MHDVLSEFKQVNVLVIGDVMLDKYFYADVSRISPEAPVPVARFERETMMLGGAANVAFNLSRLGAKVTLIGKVGDDAHALQLKELFQENFIRFLPVHVQGNTTTKTRIISRGNHLLRLDFEGNGSLTTGLESEAIALIKQAQDAADLLIVSDYRKGMITNALFSYVQKINKFSSIDTKPGVFHNFSGFNVLKPNFSEALGFAQSVGSSAIFTNTDEDMASVGTLLREKLKTDVLITRGDKGATYVGDRIIHHPTSASQVFDVTGAGDTCLAIFSLLRYLGEDISDALSVMSVAAKISVSHLGNYAPTAEDILSELARPSRKK
ncbi:MAG: hypothetical protein H6502_03195 [Candidatus Woesearchaeota archaeon]|nr:MAG: hypothetical protein H6502_03195 [Candidatus Woesearchaeota archaeon]